MDSTDQYFNRTLNGIAAYGLIIIELYAEFLVNKCTEFFKIQQNG